MINLEQEAAWAKAKEEEAQKKGEAVKKDAKQEVAPVLIIAFESH